MNRYDGPERRRPPDDHPIITHIDRRFKEFKEEIKTDLKSAFPDGDLDSHRRAHEEFIETAKDWKKTKQAVIEKVISTGVWSAVALLAVVLWNNFKDSLK